VFHFLFSLDTTHRNSYTCPKAQQRKRKITMEISETLLVTSRQQWREWLTQHHADCKEIWLIYYKKSSGKTGISYEESVEEALCFGWIDGANKGIDEETYAGRFTPRRPRSPWSASNRARVARLLQEGQMTEAGLAVLPADLQEAAF
jgi:uncharacterized protein YdeI (YjbR/CyaY-like superfamily)